MADLNLYNEITIVFVKKSHGKLVHYNHTLHHTCTVIPLLTRASSLFLFGLYMIPNSRAELRATLYELPQPS